MARAPHHPTHQTEDDLPAGWHFLGEAIHVPSCSLGVVAGNGQKFVTASVPLTPDFAACKREAMKILHQRVTEAAKDP